MFHICCIILNIECTIKILLICVWMLCKVSVSCVLCSDWTFLSRSIQSSTQTLQLFHPKFHFYKLKFQPLSHRFPWNLDNTFQEGFKATSEFVIHRAKLQSSHHTPSIVEMVTHLQLEGIIWELFTESIKVTLIFLMPQLMCLLSCYMIPINSRLQIIFQVLGKMLWS